MLFNGKHPEVQAAMHCKGMKLCTVLRRVKPRPALYHGFLLSIYFPLLLRRYILIETETSLILLHLQRHCCCFSGIFFLIACIFEQDKENASDHLTAVLKE